MKTLVETELIHRSSFLFIAEATGWVVWLYLKTNAARARILPSWIFWQRISIISAGEDLNRNWVFALKHKYWFSYSLTQSFLSVSFCLSLSSLLSLCNLFLDIWLKNYLWSYSLHCFPCFPDMLFLWAQSSYSCYRCVCSLDLSLLCLKSCLMSISFSE